MQRWASPTSSRARATTCCSRPTTRRCRTGRACSSRPGCCTSRTGGWTSGPMQSLEEVPDGRARRCRSTPTSRRVGDGSTRTTTSATWGSRTGSRSRRDTASRAVGGARQPAGRRRGRGRPAHAGGDPGGHRAGARPRRASAGATTSWSFILHDQYQGYLSDGADTLVHRRAPRRARRDRPRPSLDDVRGGRGPRARASSTGSGRAAGGRHLLMWSADPTVQAGFEAAGRGRSDRPDSLLLSLVNRSGVKLDWFMRMSADLDDRAERATSTRRCSTSRSPTRPRSRASRGTWSGPTPAPGSSRGEYLGLVTLNLPAGATNSRFDGVDPLAVAGADGENRTIAAWVHVPAGHHHPPRGSVRAARRRWRS